MKPLFDPIVHPYVFFVTAYVTLLRLVEQMIISDLGIYHLAIPSHRTIAPVRNLFKGTCDHEG